MPRINSCFNVLLVLLVTTSNSLSPLFPLNSHLVPSALHESLNQKRSKKHQSTTKGRQLSTFTQNREGGKERGKPQR